MAIVRENMRLYKYREKRGIFMFGYYGYNPSFTNTITGISAGLSIANGVLDGLKAKTEGSSTSEAVATGISTAGSGVANAIFGGIIDKNTRTYAGSIMSTAIPALTDGDPSKATPAMFGAALTTSFMPSVFGCSSFGYSPMMLGGYNPFMFSGMNSTMMYGYNNPLMFSGMNYPMMGGCCWYC